MKSEPLASVCMVESLPAFVQFHTLLSCQDTSREQRGQKEQHKMHVEVVLSVDLFAQTTEEKDEQSNRSKCTKTLFFLLFFLQCAVE